MRISLGYPEASTERQLLQGHGGRNSLLNLSPVVDLQQLKGWQQAAQKTYVADALLDYVQALLLESRSGSEHGLSPRAGMALLDAAKCWAWLSGRKQVIPEDVQSVWSAVSDHRLVDQNATGTSGNRSKQIIQMVAIP